MSAKTTRWTEPNISVVIPALNAASFLPDLIRALQEGESPPEEIIVVDDGSSDETAALARSLGCRIFHTPAARSGPAMARNLGALHAQGDILFFLDADVVPHRDAVARVRAAFASDAALDAIFGSYDDQPTDPAFLSQYKNLFHHYVHQMSSEDASTFWTGCGAIRREAFLDLGGFTDDYGRPCIEDIELGYRLGRRGGRIRLDKGLLVTHRKRWTPLGLLRTDILDRGIPWAELILRHGAFVNDLNLQTKNRISVAAFWLLMLSLALAAMWSGWMLLAALGLGLWLLRLNWPLYRWFAQKRGWWFAMRVIPWHWLYYGYNAVAFALGALAHARSAFARGHLHPERPGALIQMQQVNHLETS
ncbi:MAG: glycosyltransferase [Chloroflexi bacterium]|nr:glycosyltransferase [Chloroflexota bacterium]